MAHAGPRAAERDDLSNEINRTKDVAAGERNAVLAGKFGGLAVEMGRSIGTLPDEHPCPTDPINSGKPRWSAFSYRARRGTRASALLF